jgi:hypothetical protein
MRTPKYEAWKVAEREVESAERQFRDSGFDIGLEDREKICSQLAALKAARARARLTWREASEEEAELASRSS